MSKCPATYLVSIAGSAGAYEHLEALLATMPRNFPAAIAVALHTGPTSNLVDLLDRSSRLPVEWAASGHTIEPGHVYAAHAGAHIVINPDLRFTVSYTPRIRLFRPSADWLFDSAAASFGECHVAVVLSGMLHDGSLMLNTVKSLGGTVLVQEPDSCRYPDMPRAAIATGHVDSVLPMASIRDMLIALVVARDSGRDAARWESPFAETTQL
jgi:chemotaxis response regulator CheB